MQPSGSSLSLQAWGVLLALCLLLFAATANGQAQPENDGADSAAAIQIESSQDDTPVAYPLFTLAVGVAVVLGLIIACKVNAFVALIIAAIVVSLMAPGAWEGKIGRVADAFGNAAGGIGVVIAMAAVIGKCMLDSGAADRIVRAFLRLFGEKRSPVALLGSGFVLAVPVFFDTVFYLLVPLARSLHRKTGKNYLMYILAIAAGGAITHTLVPPTPGPLLMASNLGIDVGMMILVGALVALPAALVGLLCSVVCDRWMPIPMRQIGNQPDPEPLKDDELPSLWLSLAPVLLPVILISASTGLNTVADLEYTARFEVEDIRDWDAFRDRLQAQEAAEGLNPGKLLLAQPELAEVRETLLNERPLNEEEKLEVVNAMNTLLKEKDFYQEEAFLGVLLSDVAKAKLKADRVRMKQADVERMNRSLLESAYPELIEAHRWETPKREWANWSDVFGNANLALLLSGLIAMITLVVQRGLTRTDLASAVETALMSGGVIILITAAGGAFGKMLDVAQVGDAVQALFRENLQGGGAGFAFLILGFSIATVLKIAQGSSTIAMIVGSGMMASMVAGNDLGFHPVYLATAIGAGSLVGSWMNDSGFWIFAKMGGLTEVEALKSWTIMLAILGLVSFGMTLLLASVLPLTTSV